MTTVSAGCALLDKAMHRLAAFTLLLTASLFLLPTLAHAQGEHARRIAAELTVIASDLQKLRAGSPSKLHTTGLLQRIEGGIVALDILTRLADQELNKPIRSRYEEFNLLKKAFSDNKLERVQSVIDTLLKEYPLFLPAIAIKETVAFEQLHNDLCAACHDNPNLELERPAYNLSEQINEGSELEMFARLLIGVRGDRVTGIDNPLSDFQIIGLMQYYLH